MVGASPVGRFPASHRIRKRLEFLAIQKSGRRITTEHFVLLLSARGDTEGPARLGIVASRKVGTAVARNRAKRLTREAFRATRDLWIRGMDLVVIVRRPLGKLKLDAVASEWRAAEPHVRRRTREAERDRAEGRAREKAEGG